MKPYIIVLAVIILGGLGFVSYSQMNAQKNSQITTDTNATTTPTTETSGKKMAFSELLKQGGSYQCTVKQAVSDFNSDGLVYIDKDRIRGEFSTIAEGMKVDTSLIVRDGYNYTWSSIAPKMGFKVKIDPQVTGSTSADMSGTYSFNANQIGEYDCASWTVDESKFTLPSTVVFTEIKK